MASSYVHITARMTDDPATFIMDDAVGKVPRHSGMHALAFVFGITGQEANFLFMPNSEYKFSSRISAAQKVKLQGPAIEATAKIVARHIRIYIALMEHDDLIGRLWTHATHKFSSRLSFDETVAVMEANGSW